MLKKDAKFVWTSVHQEAFETLKARLRSPLTLTHPDFSLPFYLSTDASSVALSYALHQKQGGHEKIVTCGSKFLTPAQSNYSITTLETMAIVFGLQSCRPFLGPSQHVTVYTDHVSATYLQTLKASRGLLYRLALKLEEFQPNIQFLPGRSNIYADYLSRYAVPPAHTKPLVSSSTKSFETPHIQHSCDIDSDIEEFHEVILPLSDQASIHNHHPTSAHSTSIHVDATSPSSFGVTLHEQQDSRSSDEIRPKTISNYDDNNRINFEPDETINLLFPPKFSDLNQKFRVKHLPSIEDILIAQRNDVALQPIIAFLEHGSLPDDTAAARKIIFQSEQYILSSDGLLLHIYSNRRAKATTILKQHVQITIPAQYTQTVIHSFHDDILHSGVNKLFLQIRADFFWSSFYRDCEEYVKTCHNCQLAKNISIHTKVPTKSLDQASQPIESITIDHVGPLSHILQTNHRYILTIQCDFSRFLWAFPVQSQDGKTLVNLLFQLFCQYGFPKYCHSDNGSAFIADVTKSFFQTYSITYSRSSFHNPKSQARLERSHKTIGAILRMYPDSVHNWPDFLSSICFGLNTTPRSELANYTPAELLFGRKFQPIATLHLRNQQALSRNPNYTAYMEQLNLKLKVITDTVKVAEKIYQDANKSRLDKRTPLTTFHQGQKVLYF